MFIDYFDFLKENIKEAFTKKPKPIEMIKEVFKLLTEEEWERLNNQHDPSEEDIRDKIIEFSENKRCVYSMEKSLRVAKVKLYYIKHLHKGYESPEILLLFLKDLLVTRKWVLFRSYFW